MQPVVTDPPDLLPGAGYLFPFFRLQGHYSYLRTMGGLKPAYVPMKVSSNSVYDILIKMRDYFLLADPVRKYTKEEPFRAELYSSEQMEQQGRDMAAAHQLASVKSADQLLRRLDDNEQILLEVRNILVEAVSANRSVSPAAEWLLDNFYLIEEQIMMGKKHLPKGYSEGLPSLATGPSAGRPRVYDIALEIISHSDGRVDLRTLSAFVSAYQTVSKLTLGELWAIPIMLRLALIENLRRVASRIALDKIDQNLANYWAEQMIETAAKEPANLILLIADMVRSAPPLESPFVAEFIRALQGKGPALTTALSWMEQQLAESGTHGHELVHFENQKQAADQVSVSNCISSLRFLSMTNWQEFVETMSDVEQVLRQDAAGIYGRMDFNTRDHYRHVVERIAKRSACTESAIAEIVLGFAREAALLYGETDKRSHVGYYLADKGRARTEATAGGRLKWRDRLERWVDKRPATVYCGSIILLALLLTAGLLLVARQQPHSWWLSLAVGILGLMISGQLAVSVINWLVTVCKGPSLLPRMDFSKGIPSEYRSLVVIPTMIHTPDSVAHLIESLEVRYLANTDPHLHFALLTDFHDAEQERMPGDEELLQLLQQRIDGLNEKYRRSPADIFFALHRPRLWNPREKVWMGYERKRGKLDALNGLLRGRGTGDFMLVTGNPAVLGNVKYVITLDTDTRLPRDAAAAFVATMAHPLNHPEYNDALQRVTGGYGILQPRVAVSLPGTGSSWYTLLHANDTGLDPYTRAISDVYQDMFGEGSFIGKGIYDVDIFEQVLHERFPENRILSHDLIEGNHIRSGLLSDVLLYEEYPASYHADVKRRHRWIRGDWQIAAWVLPFSPDASGRYRRNRISALSRWKVFDNLRRSLVPASLVILLVLGWTLLKSHLFWTLVVTGFMLLPTLVNALWQLLHPPKDVTFKAHAREFGRNLLYSCADFLFNLAVLPYEAWYSLDAIVRTLWRILISRRHLLEWTPSDRTNNSHISALFRNYIPMWTGPLLALGIYVYLIRYAPVTMILVLPILILWMTGPAIAWWVSQPRADKISGLSGQQKKYLHQIARKTWAFFEDFVTEQDNWLPPDNYQEHPTEVLAHRTSPTNMGLSLLANLTAYDFGYISCGYLLERTSNTLDTMQSMERYQGHFYNWYDTISLEPLPPRYISAVDSGNLIGHLITLKQGLVELIQAPLMNPRMFNGLLDTLRVAIALEDGSQKALIAELKNLLKEVIGEPPQTLSAIKRTLEQVSGMVIVLKDKAKEGTLFLRWINALNVQVDSLLLELSTMAPWTLLPADQLEGLPVLDRNISLQQLCLLEQEASLAIAGADILRYIREAVQKGEQRIVEIKGLAQQCMALTDVGYGLLYDESKHLMRIGYNVDEQHRDVSYYDLLASEIRLGIFAGIAQGKLPQDSWFALGRLLTNTGTDPVLLSWSGSMFEYLMPQLVMPCYEQTLLHQTGIATVKRQIEYGRQRGVPWGISESGYNMVDAALNYQYRAFGVPGLGLKRGLADDLVIAPYATMMALMVLPEAACDNMQVMSSIGMEGNYGFYEAADYTAARLPRGQERVVIRSFMVHHQGMGFLALAYHLLQQPMQRRFAAEPQFQATLLLLQERIPRATLFYSHTPDITDLHTTMNDPQIRVVSNPNTPVPEIQLLSNSKYHVMVSNSGSGYSRWRDIAITRWREDAMDDHWGVFCYIRDLENGAFWSNTHQPTLQQTRNYEAVFSQGRVEYRRRDNGFETRTEVVVSPEDDIEMRRVKITNRTQSRKTIEITSYAEVVLAPLAADMAHPAFSNLFVQTEIIREQSGIICTRRPRSSAEVPPWMFHLLLAQGAEVQELSFETDRMWFTGRGHNLAAPAALLQDGPLSGTDGSVLDPIVAIRYKIVLKPGQTVSMDLVIGVAETRKQCQHLMRKYQDRHLKHRAFELSWTHSQVLLRQINATEAEAQLYGRIAGSVIYQNGNLRAEPHIISNNHRGQPGLWSYSISGDLPIVLLKVQDAEQVELVRQMVQAHTYWRLKGLTIDLVIWNDDHGTYRQLLQDQILSMITAASGGYANDGPGRIYVRSADQISNEDRILFQTVARIIIDDRNGTLSEQINKRAVSKPLPPALLPQRAYKSRTEQEELQPDTLIFSNGIGGFSADAREYVIMTGAGQRTPAPWCNVIANPDFGTVISESGSAYTWAENAHAFRLTPWRNDPVSDSCGEAFYLRDEESGRFWSPTPLPAAGKSFYRSRHGFGYSIFEHSQDGIRSELCIYVDAVASIKFAVLRLKNESGRMRRLSATAYAEWVLGDQKEKTAMHIVSEVQQGTLYIRNRYNTTFAERVVFLDAEGGAQTFTADRSEFIGRNGNLSHPAAMGRLKLSGRTGAALDPCAAIQVSVDLADNQELEILFRMGKGNHMAEAQQMVQRFKGAKAAAEALEKVKAQWEEILSAVQVETPDRSLNILANGWLTYQTLASRIWARSGYYQSGGAFGFRDQLQDVLSLMHTRPELARRQILLCASRQFREGDVQHWWHPPTGRGVRTRCSDDYLWLPYATAAYIRTTGDRDILKEEVHYLDGRPLNAEEESYYDMPNRLEYTGPLYEHCVAAIKRGLQLGAHGLPLIGSGDWNDGMDRVGEHGKGESVWLAFFLYDVLQRFSKVSAVYGDESFAADCLETAARLKEQINKEAWDGAWYRRAYFDDGTPLGAKENTECRIDSISQSWSVLSGAGMPERMRQAMEEVDKYLVRRDKGLIQLLDPPFDKMDKDPGYIKGYVPGVRENGGQYTHAAIWTLMAFAELGDNERVWELFSMINPVNHGSSARLMQTYKVEPYVVAADVYAAPQHNGRGGWTWYTGSAGWMNHFILHYLLGIRKEADRLYLKPCIPAAWPSFRVRYRYGTALYHIEVTQTHTGAEQMRVMLDDQAQDTAYILLHDDGAEHRVEISLPARRSRKQQLPE